MIRDGDGKLAITPGTISRCDNGFMVCEDGHTIMHESRSRVEMDATTDLYVEAHNVTNATNRTPAELLKERDEWEAEAVKLKYTLFELRKALDYIAVNPTLPGDEVRKIAAEALAKSEGV
jgi:hypothetical protein